jgi:hypothetical protein
MRVGDKIGLMAIAFVVCFFGASSARLSVAHAGDAREDRINHESPDQSADAQVGDSAGDSADPTANSAGARVGGHWSGGVTDSSLGAGTLDLLLNQHDRVKLGGGFDMSFASAEDFAGSLKGTSNKKGVTLTLKPNKQQNCRVALSPTSVTSAEIKGAYSTRGCAGLTNGSFDVTFEHR